MFNKEVIIADKKISLNSPTYFIAEIGANFDGSIEKAKQLVDAVKEAGADCAKFQSFLTPKIVSRNGFLSMNLQGVHGSWGRTVDEVFKDAEFPREWHKEISEYCTNVGIHFSSSPYDFEAVDLLVKLNVPFIKIGSGEITWHEMIEYCASQGKPVMLATGDATMSEIDEAIRVIKSTGNKDIVLMQCITNYPSQIESANIRVLETYKNAFDVLTGYSDHSPGPVVTLGSVALGARVIEKHFTLSKKDKGPDHPHSMEMNDFKTMVQMVRELEAALGSTVKEVVAEEAETVYVQRRGLCSARKLEKGTVLSQNDIDVLRPALGIQPKFKNILIGKTINKDIEVGMPIHWEDLS